ncbi:MAG: D-alanyl-D-alanine carboxypeptidase [Alphaproteobacteria bacterium]|jgi:D-alanyl-D-alanine carboxypeptidase (penicillin-binding protein 5/6)|nr:D-alanyl-D-alanine carboxypeptidase [Alphaproteobacteria bacterium]
MSIIARLGRVLFVASAILGLGPAIAMAQGFETAARQAFMVDFQTGAVMYNKNGDELMPPSSMSKLMTAFMVFERLAAGTLHMTDQMGVSEKAWKTGGSKMFVHVGDRVSVEDLLRGVIIQSGNDACVVLAEGLAGSEERFAEQMTARARELGMSKSVFKNATGLPQDGHLMTPRELALLAREIIIRFPQFYRFYSEISFTYNNIKQGNRNPLLYKNTGADGMKTGHTDAAGYGLTASAKRDGRRIIMVVNGLKSMNERSRESERLLDWGFNEFDTYKIFSPGQVVDTAGVWLGVQPSVPLTVSKETYVTLSKRDRPGLKVTAVWDNPIPAPIQAGQPVGRLLIAAPEMDRLEQPRQIEVPLVAAGPVDRLGFAGRIQATLLSLVGLNKVAAP